jgi:hypothetical protein
METKKTKCSIVSCKKIATHKSYNDNKSYCQDCASLLSCESANKKEKEHPILCLEKYFYVIDNAEF